ncbi:MAG: hypothetical protein ACE5E6_07880 [Phycisphaerae bacterium]
MGAAGPNFAARIRAQLAASPGKAAALVVLAVVFVIVVAMQVARGPVPVDAAQGVAVPGGVVTPAGGSAVGTPAGVLPGGMPAGGAVVRAPGQGLVPRPAMHTQLTRDPFEAAWLTPPPVEREPVAVRGDARPADRGDDEPTLVLEATYRSHGVPLAVINGVTYHEGDKLGGYVIERIASRHVALRSGAQRRLLWMP